MTRLRPRTAGTALAFVLVFACAGDPRPSRAATPDSLLRDLSTDRPDLTESPYTVDAGHVQLEMDLVAYARDEAGGARAESWAVAPVNVKLGLTRSADLQVIVETHRRDRLTDVATGARSEARGVGDVTVRLKRNL